MNKFEALIYTGKLEVRLQENEQAISELKNLQKYIAADDFMNVSISLGKITVLAKTETAEEINEDIGAIYEYVAGISKETVKEMSITEMGLSLRTTTCLTRAGIDTLSRLLTKTDESLMKVRNLGKRSYNEVVNTVQELGYPWFPREASED